jgi:hypothetical protein
MAAKKETTEQAIAFELPKIDIKYLSVQIIGDSPLIVHKWSEKAKKEMLDKQMKKASAGKQAKDPWMDYCESMYWLDGMPENPTEKDIKKARFGFPAVAFKACAIDAAYQQGAITKKTTARGAFHLVDELVEIIGTPQMREDMVQVGGMSKVADIRYRGEFPEWKAVLNIRYNAGAISPEQILNMLNIGGFSNGVGEWRPSRDGSFGTFHVATADE